jgi:hypothetical protein
MTRGSGRRFRTSAAEPGVAASSIPTRFCGCSRQARKRSPTAVKPNRPVGQAFSLRRASAQCHLDLVTSGGPCGPLLSREGHRAVLRGKQDPSFAGLTDPAPQKRSDIALQPAPSAAKRFVRHSTHMARAAVRLVFAAMLALLTTQLATPSVRLVAAFESVWHTEIDQAEAEQRPQTVTRVCTPDCDRQTTPAYSSFVKPDPDAVLFFQLPPPAKPFNS